MTAPTSAPGTAHHRSLPLRRAGSGCSSASTASSSCVFVTGEDHMVPTADRHTVHAFGGSHRRYGWVMLDRLKVSAREKLQRALAEVVAAEHARARQEQQDQHIELMAALDRLNDSVKAVVTRIADTEYRARRDLSYAQDARAAQESAAFVLEHM